MTHTRRVALGSACLLALIVPACGSDDDAADSSAPTPAASDAAGSGATTPGLAAGLSISGNNFSAASVTVGTEFTVTNNDSVAHTVTDDAGAFSVDVPAGGTAPLTIDSAGTYAIHCEIHGSMRGSITAA